MVFAGAVILPHGALSFDGNPDSFSEECQQRHMKMKPAMRESTTRLYNGCIEAGKCVAEMEPDLIILHTPHGISLSTSIALYGNNKAAGTAEWKARWTEFQVEVPLCQSSTLCLQEQLNSESGIVAERVTMFGRLGPNPLRWGEVIPLWYIKNSLKHDIKSVIMAVPRPSKGHIDNIEEVHTKCGEVLARFVEKDPRKIVIAISGDLSHMYDYECKEDYYTPDPSSNFPDPRDDEARAMEKALKQWVLSSNELSAYSSSTVDGSQASDPELPQEKRKAEGNSCWNSSAALPPLQAACQLNPRTLSCGIGGFIMLHACLKAISTNMRILPQIHTCEAPSYYGMMAATFTVDK